MKELYEFSLSSNGLKVGFDGPEKEIADGALAAAYVKSLPNPRTKTNIKEKPPFWRFSPF